MPTYNARMTGTTPTSDRDRIELLRRAIALGDELLRLTDDLGQLSAGNHISHGVEIMRADLERRWH